MCFYSESQKENSRAYVESHWEWNQLAWQLWGADYSGFDIEHRDEADWVERCTVVETEGTGHRGCLKNYLSCCVREDMESFGLRMLMIGNLESVETENQGGTG